MKEIDETLKEYLARFRDYKKGSCSKAELDKAAEKYRAISEAYKWRCEI